MAISPNEADQLATITSVSINGNTPSNKPFYYNGKADYLSININAESTGQDFLYINNISIVDRDSKTVHAINGGIGIDNLDAYLENWSSYWENQLDVPLYDELIFDFISGKWYIGSNEQGRIFTDKIETFIFTGVIQ